MTTYAIKNTTSFLVTSVFVAFILAFGVGCGPRGGIEWGHVPTGNFDPDPGNLSPFGMNGSTGNGIIYTKLGGSIDPDHIWGWGRYAFKAYRDIFPSILSGKSEIKTTDMEIRIISYPSYWASLEDSLKKRKAHEISMELARTIAFHQGIYHELNTYWGFGFDYESTFSWEDMYSNCLGVNLAMQAQDMEFNGKGKSEALMTKITQEFINGLSWVGPSEANRVNDSLVNIYWKNRPIQREQIARNVDIGLDGYIDNTPLPGFTPPREKMVRIPAPRIDYSNFMDFKIDILVSPSMSQYGKAKSFLGINRQINIKDHPRLIELLKQEFKRKGYLVFD